MHIARLKTNRIQNFLQLGYPFVFPFDFPLAATFKHKNIEANMLGKILKTTPRQSVSPMRTTHKYCKLEKDYSMGK